MKSDCAELMVLLEEKSAELNRAHRELYHETARRWHLEKEIKKYRDYFKEKVTDLAAKLEKALEEDQNLKGFLTICSSCKNILDEDDQWSRIEKFIERRSEVVFTHSICPSCSRKLYPQLHDKQEDAL